MGPLIISHQSFYFLFILFIYLFFFVNYIYHSLTNCYTWYVANGFLLANCGWVGLYMLRVTCDMWYGIIPDTSVISFCRNLCTFHIFLRTNWGCNVIIEYINSWFMIVYHNGQIVILEQFIHCLIYLYITSLV